MLLQARGREACQNHLAQHSIGAWCNYTAIAACWLLIHEEAAVQRLTQQPTTDIGWG